MAYTGSRCPSTSFPGDPGNKVGCPYTFSRFQVYINSSLHLARNYARIFVRGHYLFREVEMEAQKSMYKIKIFYIVITQLKYFTLL